jgi:hypothetical protein
METFDVGPEIFEVIWWIALVATLGFGALWLAALSARRRTRAGACMRSLLRGTVEFARGQSGAFNVSIEDWQVSDAHGSKTWHPQQRTAEVYPFILLTDNGTRIRIVPTLRDQLVMRCNTIEQVSNAHRTRRTELLAGERIWVEGSVHGSTE